MGPTGKPPHAKKSGMTQPAGVQPRVETCGASLATALAPAVGAISQAASGSTAVCAQGGLSRYSSSAKARRHSERPTPRNSLGRQLRGKWGRQMDRRNEGLPRFHRASGRRARASATEHGLDRGPTRVDGRYRARCPCPSIAPYMLDEIPAIGVVSGRPTVNGSDGCRPRSPFRQRGT